MKVLTVLRKIASTPQGAFGLGVLILFFSTAIVVGIDPAVVGYNAFAFHPKSDLAPPSLQNPFGADNFGRSVFSQVLRSMPLDAFISLSVVGVSVFVGGLLGAVAGYFGGVVEDITMRTTDLFLAFPAAVLTIAVATALGPGALNAMVALMVVNWTTYARLARGDTLSLRGKAFVMAAQINGKGAFFILRKHVLPNIVPSLLAIATVGTGAVMITFSVLGYLGLGAQPPSIELGMLVYQGQSFLRSAPWYPLIPGATILVVTMAFAFVGDSIREVLLPSSSS